MFCFLSNNPSEILLEERVSDCETMKRENRRVAAMSWNVGDDLPPPKPSRGAQPGKKCETINAILFDTDVLNPQFLLLLLLLVITEFPSMFAQGDGSVPQTYIIAQNPTVLAQLMRENESRPLNPSAYNTPASVFNTIAVDIDATKSEATVTDTPLLPLKTVMLPASEILKLNPIVDETLIPNASNVDANGSELMSNNATQQSLDPNSSPVNQMISPNIAHSLGNSPNMQSTVFQMPCTQSQNLHSLDHIFKTAPTSNVSLDIQQQHHHQQKSPQLTPLQHHHQQQQQQQQQFLHHQIQQNIAANTAMYAPSGATFFQQSACPNVVYSANLPPHSDASQKSRSLERNTPLGVIYASRMSSLERIQTANQLKQMRSNSLTRQLSQGNEVGCPPNVDYSSNARSGSLERTTRLGLPNYSCRTNSLERNNQMGQPAGELVAIDVHRGGSLERNQSIASAYNVLKNRTYRGGSLERNHQNMAIVNRSISLERNAQHQEQLKARDPEPFQEDIYDFGGANVKSCATIALNKSISKGLVPAGTTLPSSTNPSPPLPPSTSQSPMNYPMHKMPPKSPNLPPPPPLQSNAMSQSFQANSMHFPLPPPPELLAQAHPPFDMAYSPRAPMGQQMVMSQPLVMGQAPSMAQPIMGPQGMGQHGIGQPGIGQPTVMGSHYTPMYPLMWPNQPPAQFQTAAHKYTHTQPQMTQIPMAMNVNSVCKNSLMQDAQPSIHSDDAIENDGFAAQV